MEELLIGFDIREMWLPAWPPQRQLTYCLRPDVEKVLSADSWVWPSVFDLEPDLRRPAGCCFVQDMWGHLKSMIEAGCAGQVDPDKLSWIIAIVFVPDMSTADALPFWASEPRIPSPSALDSRWEFLGYDVADDFLLSGLSGCGYSPDTDSAQLRQQWASHLNKYHLFCDLSHAKEFRNLSDARVPEHSPFFLYSLWTVRGRIITHGEQKGEGTERGHH